MFLLFEEWGWEPLAAVFAALGRLPVWRQLERLIVRLPPWAALLAFGVPVLALIPIKLLAVYLLGQGHVATGLGIIVLAKLAGTAFAARLFQLTQPALMQIQWFASLYVPWKIWKDYKLRQVRSSLPWRWSRRLRQRVKLLATRVATACKAAFSGLRK
ncbi:hypothetical protein RCH06_001918 [Polaromonas sp. CG_9.5]|uniref:hypothetical protein n=1 Tax=Polaromonas sp. CG_9.5 TaxID=3071705 RepID=UPI002E02F0FF|nr:hypothetical protein [Polaromonas sp. CG_9.5]